MKGPTLVTGASGFIGKAVVAYLSSKGEEVVAISRGECNLADPLAVEELLARVRPKLIYNCAGVVTGDFQKALEGNVVIPHNLLAAMVRLGLSSRILLLGSAGEYGAVAAVDNPVRETQPLAPVSINGLTKTFQSALMDFYVRMHGVDAVMARVFNVQGSGADQHLFVGRVAQEIERYKRGEIRSIETGSLESLRDYLPVEEIAQYCAAIMGQGGAGEIYNVGSGQPTRMRDLLRGMLLDASIPFESVLEGAFTPSKFDVPIMYADISKLKKMIA